MKKSAYYLPKNVKIFGKNVDGLEIPNDLQKNGNIIQLIDKRNYIGGGVTLSDIELGVRHFTLKKPYIYYAPEA